ncbi:tRNA (adenosine(37)-N6)-dimethylallyltransferase MiaA [Ammoniphilus resinae]|uniref:tRNA dimethylallyltransferase n=1 Tax=Ammoniphilus resinae TaxID=861532 RepID=A0ABS4GNZ8_9BACL|nr:tRNA (adenosine(37)-N6)-dimethylallyltransferase MiaA [Ammoniphilus resinae]MBP1931585.1 tRNA dimethylallyltransferase [Ammoniphilus resinae]
MKEKLLVLVGPTAVGKTALSVKLAHSLDGEVISGDSIQVYKGMDIGTAKITVEEMDGIVHHLIDILEPDETFSVNEFQKHSRRLITEINQRGKLPMIVGGTGLYIQSVIYDYQFSKASQNQELRDQLEAFAACEGKEALHKRLAEIDPVTASRLHPNDVKRIVRAIEIYQQTGTSMAEYQQRSSVSPYQLCLIGLTMERSQLYERINHRVDLMIEQGLIEEVQSLLKRGYNLSYSSMQAIGYKEIIAYLEGNLSKEESIELLKKNSRHFAKRQLTWFRSMKEIHWFEVAASSNGAELVENIRSFAEGMLMPHGE